MKHPHSPLSARLLGLAVLALACLAPTALRAAASVAGTYDSEGTVAHSDSGYDGPVSLRALLALEFDLARGALQHPDVTRIEIEQQERRFIIRTRNSGGAEEWAAEWGRNGGFEATAEGVKLVIRARSPADDLYMFTFSPVNHGAALLVKVQRLKAAKFAVEGTDLGTFLFLRAEEN